jgi:pyridoxal phosphate enzyme (YggS family)
VRFSLGGKFAWERRLRKGFLTLFAWVAPRLSHNRAMSIAENLAGIRARMEAACGRAGRDPASVLLLPVSKGHSAGAVEEAAALGLRVFAENKVQEAKVKIPQCSSRLQWQMIGHLQSNKARDAVHLFSLIQSIDSLALAEEVNKWAEKLSKRIPVLLEVNTAGEASKYGFAPENIPIREINDLSRLEVQGLMSVAPYTTAPERVRPYFRKLRELKDACSDKIGAPLPHLSMGMSGDFEIAIEEGATIIRIGTALFGPRSYAAKTAIPL